ncbi:MAG: (2Fe-2S)-binding protein [Dehalococcoidia bacterium]|nr:(2Fe-2S)-binding protein [Dehalococcoidia bacterium]
MDCTVIIEGRETRAKSNSNLLWTALDNGFYIPNLCAIRDRDKTPASCRLCFVEIVGRPQPVTACTETVSDGMKVTLNSPGIQRLRKSSFDLLMSNHRLNCSHCSKNKNCDLQKIAHREGYKLTNRNLKIIDFSYPVDASHPLISFDRNKCILCGKCVWVCQHQGKGVLDFAFRGINTIVSTFAGIPLSETDCDACLACVAVCPAGALYLKQPQPEGAYV